MNWMGRGKPKYGNKEGNTRHGEHRLLPPPERCVPHRTPSNGEGGWALWRPQGTWRQDRRPPGRRPFRDPQRISELGRPWRVRLWGCGPSLSGWSPTTPKKISLGKVGARSGTWGHSGSADTWGRSGGVDTWGALEAQAQLSAFEGLALEGTVEERALEGAVEALALAWNEPRPAGLPHEPPAGLPYSLLAGLPYSLPAGLGEPRTAAWISTRTAGLRWLWTAAWISPLTAPLRWPRTVAGEEEPRTAGWFWLGPGHSPDTGRHLPSNSVQWCLGGPRDGGGWPRARTVY